MPGFKAGFVRGAALLLRGCAASLCVLSRASVGSGNESLSCKWRNSRRAAPLGTENAVGCELCSGLFIFKLSQVNVRDPVFTCAIAPARVW